MNNLLKKFLGMFGLTRVSAPNSALPSSRMPQQSVLHDGSETATRSQLVQVLLRDLVRKCGMPIGWVQCQIQVVNSRSRGQGIYVRLVIKQWDERLMTYAFAFQKALLTDIVQFEPKAGDWLQGIAWQLEVAGSCPLTELPGPGFWQQTFLAAQPDDQFDIIPLPARAPEPAATVPVTVAALDAIEPSPMLLNVPAEPQDETAQDLERLFAIRDNELANLATNNPLPAGYESTEPAPLQIR